MSPLDHRIVFVILITCSCPAIVEHGVTPCKTQLVYAYHGDDNAFFAFLHRDSGLVLSPALNHSWAIYLRYVKVPHTYCMPVIVVVVVTL